MNEEKEWMEMEFKRLGWWRMRPLDEGTANMRGSDIGDPASTVHHSQLFDQSIFIDIYDP